VSYEIISLRHIEVLHAMNRMGTVARAAGLLGISQPAATKLIREAERRLGYRLFDRVQGRLVPTNSALLLWPEIERLEAQLAHVRRLAGNLHPEREKRIRVGCLPSLALGVVPDAIRAHRLIDPSVHFQVVTQHTDELIGSLRAQEIDVALAFAVPATTGVRVERVCRGHLVQVRKDPGPREVGLAELAGAPIVGLSPTDPLAQVLRAATDAAGVPLAPQMEVQTYFLACALVERGCGTAVVDLFTADAWGADRLSAAKIRPVVGFDVVLLTNELRALPSPCVAFADLLRAECRAVVNRKAATK
jgi:DNA-binding transcriptional LysR family regulator